MNMKNFAPTFQRKALCSVGVCWVQLPPFHLLHESINVQIKLFIKVARGAGGSAYCDQQWGRVSLDVKSSNCQITKLRQNAFEKSTQKLPLKLGCTIGPSRLYSLKYRTGGCLERFRAWKRVHWPAKIDGPAKFARRKDEGVFKVSDNRRDQTLYFLHCL